MASDTQARNRETTARGAAGDDVRAAHASLAGRWLPLLATVGVLVLLAGLVRWLWQDYDSQTARERSLAQPNYTELAWDTLVPKDWDPMRQYRGAGIDRLDDADPAAVALARRMRETWDNAPTNPTLDGARVRLSGYVVPLDMQRADMREFLLVPYFGACIHVPAPAANQLVHVRLGAAAAALRTMDTVWVSGTLHTRRNDSPMGVSGYSMDADHVERRTVLRR
jgi:uncharacterized protein